MILESDNDNKHPSKRETKMTTEVNAVRNVVREIREGVSGSGNTIYLVVTACAKTGQWIHSETFRSKSEAECWMKWA